MSFQFFFAKLLNLLLHRSFAGSRVLFSFRASINGFKRAELTIFLASILSFQVCAYEFSSYAILFAKIAPKGLSHKVTNLKR